MKSSHSVWRIAAAVAGALMLHAELSQWVQHIEGGSPLDAIFFRTIALPNGPVPSRRPPRETIPDLTKAIVAAPGNGDLIALRAQERELQLDFKSAEVDWQAYRTQATDKLQAAIALADFYHRRLQPKEEFDALLEAARLPSSASDLLLPEPEHSSWKLFERTKALVEASALGPTAQSGLYQAWMSRYPARAEVRSVYATVLIAGKRYAEAEQLVANADAPTKVRIQAAIEESRGSATAARAVYDRAFDPLWPPELIAEYFRLLDRTRSLRAYLADARAAATANPTALEPAVRIFYYYQQSGNLPQAHRALLELRLRKQTWTQAELLIAAKLFEATHNYPEAARHYNDAIASQQGLAGLIRVLLSASEQPLRIGSGDLTYYRDIARLDTHPGFLNGVLSLLFNASYPENEFDQQERAAIPYFHRAKAAELLADLDKRFPASTARADLHAALIDVYGEYGEDKTVIEKGTRYLTAFPKTSGRTNVALAMADAYARMNRLKEEFATYDNLLRELSAAAAGVPLGGSGSTERTLPRSADYARVLDRYLARLASLKRVKEAIALYRAEIDRNPNDPGLYDRLAQFLEQNKRAAEIEAVYTRATKHFQDRGWYHKLARWYLRQKQAAQFDRLAREVAGIFTGTELETYFAGVVASAELDTAMYRQVNLYAHKRFPHDLVFVKNLVASADPATAEPLLRSYWYYDADLRSRFFSMLSRTGRLEAELQALAKLPATDLADRAANQFIAEAQIWRCHFEAGAPALQVVANTYQGDSAINDRAASLYRSMGQTDVAIRFAARLNRLEPRSFEALTRVGDIYADREQFDRARPHWNGLTAIEPGKPDGYLEAATIYWDYYLYDDALRVIDQGRKQLATPSLFAFEAGAIYENRRDNKRAIAEYMAGATADPEGAARRRLLRLAERPAYRSSIETATASGPFDLRVAVLEQQNRRDDLSAYLTSTAKAATAFDLLARVDEIAARNELPPIRLLAVDRQIAITPDPLEKTRLRLASVRLLEQQRDLTAAERRLAEIHRENPTLLGVVRATTDFYWRNKQGPKALDTLEQAASRSNAEFRRSFSLEAARKATDLAEYARGRKVLDPLLALEPAAADLIAAAADTYARAGDDAGMRTFLAARLKATTGDAQAQLRRTLIPVLVRMKDFAGAADQYIEVIKRYPEDVALLQEAANFARRNEQSARLLTYFAKATADSPKDARWPAVQARLESRLDRLEEASRAYSRALAIRPDRVDLMEERASAEERLLRFADAAASYRKLYELAHRNPSYLVKAAETHARLGDKPAALQALRTAFLENVKPRAQEYFELARTVHRWGWTSEAMQFASDGLGMWQPNTNDAVDQLALFMQLSTHLRQSQSAWTSIANRLPEGSGDRILWAAAEAVRTHYTPEEKVTFAQFLESTPAGDRPGIAQTAGLVDVAVRALHQQFTTNPTNAVQGQWNRLADLQQRRMQYSELAYQLETYWRALPPQDGNRNELLQAAAQAQRTAGNPKDELRLLGLLEQTGSLGGPSVARYAELLRTIAPARLVELASRGSAEARNTAASAALSGADADLALRAITARGHGLPPVWTSAYTALTGHHFNQSTPQVRAAFDTLMGPRTVGAQLASRPDTNVQLTGDNWFPYAARYGEYLGLRSDPTAEDFLVAELERRPLAPSLYLALGDWYRDRSAAVAAMAEYSRALQIQPRYPEAHARIAGVLASQGKLAEAQAEWRLALDGWNAMQEARLPEDFWPGVANTFEAIGQHKSFVSVRTEADRLLRTYLRRNGLLRIEPLLKAAAAAAGNGKEAMAWIFELSRAAPNPLNFLGSIADEDWLPAEARDDLYQQLMRLAESDAARLAGQARQEAQWVFRNWRMHWYRNLLSTGRGAQAWTLIQALDDETRMGMPWEILVLELRAASSAKTLDRLLARYTQDTDPPSDDDLRRAADMIRTAGDEPTASRLLEFVFTRELQSSNGSASAYLGLAEMRLKAGDVPSALTLIQRMNHSIGLPFEFLADAGALLERNGRTAEAIELWRTRVRAVPWDNTAAAALARLTNDTAALQRIATSTSTPYVARASSAPALAGSTNLGSRELDLLAAPAIDPKDAEAPYFFHARMKCAAQPATEPAVRVRLLRGALAIDPYASEPRPLLFQAAISAGQPSVSIAAWHPLLAQTSIGYALQSPERFRGRVEYMAQQFLSAAGLTQAERAAIAQQMAGSYRKLNQAQPALLMLQLARELDATRNVTAEVQALERQQSAIEENRRRMPMVSEGITQPNRVKPRLEGGVQ